MQEDNKKEYSFNTDEKEILNKLNIIESSVEQNIQLKNQRELIATKYYSEFVLNTPNGSIMLNNVFITTEKDQQGKTSYHFRWIIGKEEQTIEEYLVIDEDGKAYVTGELGKYLNNEEINIKELMLENDDIKKGRLKGISEKAKSQDIEKTVKKQKENENNEEKQEIEEDLESQGQNLELTNIRKIKDTHIKERMPDIFGDAEQYAQAYSKKLNKFIILEKSSQVKGKNNVNKTQWQINENVQPAKTTLRTIISIDENGKSIERKVPYALMKTNNADKEIAVNIGQYGEINIETVDVLPCQERIARGVREQGEGLNKEESAQIRREFKTQGKNYTHNLAHQVKEIEEAQIEINQNDDTYITETDYIPNTKITWGELMQKTGESLPQLVERFNKDMEKNDGKKENDTIVQDIIEDYSMITHERTRR